MTAFYLTDPASTYIFGFMQADGHHRAGAGKKGSITVEIKAGDAALLMDMQAVLPWKTSISYRSRATDSAVNAGPAAWPEGPGRGITYPAGQVSWRRPGAGPRR
jgi:hypothetical protein